MKKILIIIVSLISTAAYGQNEFANQKFYDAVKKVYADADGNFKLYKGTKQNSEISGFVDSYTTKQMLPGANSGSIVTTLLGNWYANYTFNGVASLEVANRKGTELMTAIATAINKTLNQKSESSTIKDVTFYNVYYSTTYKNPGILQSDFETTVYYDKGKYVVSLKINGRVASQTTTVTEKKSKLSPEANLGAKIQEMVNNASGCFTDYRGATEITSALVTKYKTSKTLFGLTGIVEDWKLECGLNYSVGFTELTGLDEANDIYGQLKSALQSSLAGKISFSAEEQSKYNEYSYSITGMDAGKNSLQTKMTITLTVNREKAYPAVYLRIKKVKY